MSGSTLLVLQDSPDYGGHETMFLRLLPDVAASGAFERIVIRFAEGNERLRGWFAERRPAKVEAEGWPFTKQRGEPYFAGFRRRYAGAVRSLIARERPSALLLLQGRIENLAVPMLAAPPETFLVSYVPMAQKLAELERSSVPGDMVRRRLYRRPDRYIVPSAAVAAQVRAAGGSAEAIVVDNIVAPPPPRDRAEARAALDLPADRPIALMLGRLDTRQKGIDRLAMAIRRDRDRLAGWTILIVGDGEGAPLVDALAADLAGRVDLRRLGWTDRPHDYLAAADLLLMPSRWEGVPLVMLEAMTYGVPLLGSRIDVFREYLPSALCHDFETGSLADAMAAAIVPAAIERYRVAARRRIGDGDLARSAARFVTALQK
jgi:glycosyltransferase involved in cell wall biosynthesis